MEPAFEFSESLAVERAGRIAVSSTSPSVMRPVDLLRRPGEHRDDVPASASSDVRPCTADYRQVIGNVTIVTTFA